MVTLSERANVSTATIVRLMKKIGYNGYVTSKIRIVGSEGKAHLLYQ
ncbi:hypothetical protein M5W27_17550 [Bacillus xiamenensis]|uniref:HTH rpiR-type domain-containing protein n=1 Tax=Bacillus xiamenensis TaxID=1178537 RepID=A0ABT4FAG7_9BACI|nr:hypothetical protein [Bacillus sp. ms-22]MCY9577586.1 hypothetical protein [Bacillus xiamenensis]